ncbi:MAG: helix-turn-helix domain-containing protein [Candidatus Moranbacteria bacterium]|nr:helix-turn-helix domain-containing protein [Candidatus Moranbacteria bacterium]
MILDKLITNGFDKKEAQVYITILELGEGTIAEITKKSLIKRSTVYEMIELLKKRGIISQSRRKKRPVFLAENPKKLLELLEEEKRGLEEIMPELLSITNLIDKKPKIRYFEGKEAYKEVFNDVLKYPGVEMLGTFNEKFWDYEGFFTDYFMPERQEKKIWARILFRNNPVLRDVAEELGAYFSQTKLVPSEKFNIQIEMVVYGYNKVGFVSYNEEMAIIIESQKIHDTQKGFFETIWDLLPEKNNGPAGISS